MSAELCRKRNLLFVQYLFYVYFLLQILSVFYTQYVCLYSLEMMIWFGIDSSPALNKKWN